ncbi:redoxin domain-containing protein [Alphaproteobacteria bacterium]|nr:redoxin domain-containing protein [Alphaproteobacteria bacterium]
MHRITIIIIPIILLLTAFIIITNLNYDKSSIKKPYPPLPKVIFENLSYFKNIPIGSSLNEKVYIINFFASWCAPCLAEHPTFMNLKQKNIIIIGINFRDDEENLNKWLEEHGNPYEYVIRDDGDIAFKLGLIGVPETYFVKDQLIYKKIQGPLFKEDIEEFL